MSWWLIALFFMITAPYSDPINSGPTIRATFEPVFDTFYNPRNNLPNFFYSWLFLVTSSWFMYSLLLSWSQQSPLYCLLPQYPFFPREPERLNFSTICSNKASLLRESLALSVLTICPFSWAKFLCHCSRAGGGDSGPYVSQMTHMFQKEGAGQVWQCLVFSDCLS